MSIFTSNDPKQQESEGFENKVKETKEDENVLKKKNQKRNRDQDRIHQDDTNLNEDDGKDDDSEPIKTNNKKIIQFDKEKKNKNVINYASTVQDAYSNLNEIIGSDGIKHLTKDTKNLMVQQMKLAESMKNIEPLINGFGPILDKAQGLLGSIDTNAFNNIKSLAKNFSI
jgi:hypothetical protein